MEKIALVTGASRGIGKATALALARDGWTVHVNYIQSRAAAEAVAAQTGGMAICADVSDGQAVEAMFEKIGPVDLLVNNAGVTRDNLLLRMSEEDYDRVLDTNLKGAVFCCKAVARPMMRQRYGRIVNLSSVVGLRGNAGQVNYSASKAGLLGLTKSLAKELASRGVTANAVAPGFIETDMTNALPEAARSAMAAGIPAGRPGLPEEVARAVAFFAREDAGYITGQVLCVDGGMAV